MLTDWLIYLDYLEENNQNTSFLRLITPITFGIIKTHYYDYYFGYGFNYADGSGNGYCFSYGFGYGYGYGDGSGDGFGYGFGDGYDYFNAYNEEH